MKNKKLIDSYNDGWCSLQDMTTSFLPLLKSFFHYTGYGHKISPKNLSLKNNLERRYFFGGPCIPVPIHEKNIKYTYLFCGIHSILCNEYVRSSARTFFDM